MSEANPMRGPTARPHISLGQRPRTHEYREISPVGATHLRRRCTEIARPYRAVVFLLPNPGALPQANMAPHLWCFHGIRFANEGGNKAEDLFSLFLIHHTSVVNQK